MEPVLTARVDDRRVSGGASLSDTAYQHIKRAIIRCDLEPGRQMTENELVERFAVGRAAVRTALSRLLPEGLVQVLPRQGYFVTPVTLKRVSDLVGVRLLLEPSAARMAVGRVDVMRLREMDDQYQAHFILVSAEHLEALMRANREFHLAVAHASGNQRLADIIHGLLHEMERLFHLGFKMHAQTGNLYEHNHADMIAAFERDDAASAEQLMRDQILATQTLIVGALIASPTLQSANVSIS